MEMSFVWLVLENQLSSMREASTDKFFKLRLQLSFWVCSVFIACNLESPTKKQKKNLTVECC